ncbi:MAG: hypothetical protein ACRC3Z_04070 [Phocaeicola sp.]
MTRLIYLFTLILICQSSYAQEVNQFYLAGCGNKFIARADYQSGQILWRREAPVPEDCNDIKIYREGILYAYRQGARMITEKGKTLWDYKAPEGFELYSARKVSGGYLVAMCAPETPILIYLDRQGVVKEKIEIKIGDTSVHDQIRHVAKWGKNNYLVPIMATGEILCLDKKGYVKRGLKVGGTPFSISQSFKKDVWWVACGDGSKIVAIDVKKWEIISEITNSKLEKFGVKMLFVAEVQELSNGHLMVANWNGHTKDKSQPKLFVITPEGELVSTLPPNDNIHNISSFDLIK